MKNSFALLLFAWLTAIPLWAQDKAPALKLATVFGDHMVLQQGKPTSIFGSAAPNGPVTVKFAGQTHQTKADGKGEWSVTLNPLKTNKVGQALTVSAGGESAKLSDILVGEVWMCSGQSNMAWRLSQTTDWEKAAAGAKFPQIRLFTTPTSTAKSPQRDVLGGTWQICSPETAPNFSGVGYHFGRQLHQKLDVPIGMVCTAWGGKPSEAFTSREMLESVSTAQKLLDDWDARQKAYNPTQAKANFEKALAAWEKKVAEMRAAAKESGKPVARFPRRPATPMEPYLQSNCPTAIYNQMIAPWNPVAIAGAIWYQGESNASRARQYETIFPAMIQDWRNQRNDAIPFHLVQLANFRAPSTEPGRPDSWAELQNAQTLTLKKQVKTGMAIINDIGEANDIHPRNKKDVGERLARWALANDYGKEVDVISGPIYSGHEIVPGGIRVQFDYTGEGLASRDGKPLARFEIAGKDQKWHWADVSIEEGGKSIFATSLDVLDPVAVRYAWAANPEGANLVNSAGLPASLFRTDDWPLSTDASGMYPKEERMKRLLERRKEAAKTPATPVVAKVEAKPAAKSEPAKPAAKSEPAKPAPAKSMPAKPAPAKVVPKPAPAKTEPKPEPKKPEPKTADNTNRIHENLKKAGWEVLFNGTDTKGWKNPYDYGKIEVKNGEIHLTSDKKFFLVTEKTYGDFQLTAEIHLPEGKANSGVMFRCHVEPGNVYGYQAECDGSERRWSGGLYDEARRGWIWPSQTGRTKEEKFLAHEEESQAFMKRPEVAGALKRNGWNKYQITCKGNRIQIRVNNVLITNIEDDTDAQGHIGIQHHGEKGAVYRFRNIYLKPL